MTVEAEVLQPQSTYSPVGGNTGFSHPLPTTVTDPEAGRQKRGPFSHWSPCSDNLTEHGLITTNLIHLHICPP